ncbi:MAG: hypothetical protein U0610_06270 [bacterium]
MSRRTLPPIAAIAMLLRLWLRQVGGPSRTELGALAADYLPLDADGRMTEG